MIFLHTFFVSDCERNDGNDFCGELAYQAGSQLDEAAQQCQTDCTSFACTSAIQQVN